MRLLTTVATFVGVTMTADAPDFKPVYLLVYKLPGGETLPFPPKEPRSLATLVKNAQKTLTITAVGE